MSPDYRKVNKVLNMFTHPKYSMTSGLHPCISLESRWDKCWDIMRNRQWALHFWKPTCVNTPQDCRKRQEIPRVENSCKVGLSPKTKYSAWSQWYHVLCKKMDFVNRCKKKFEKLVKTALENQKPPSFSKTNCCPSAFKYEGNINCQYVLCNLWKFWNQNLANFQKLKGSYTTSGDQ